LEKSARMPGHTDQWLLTINTGSSSLKVALYQVVRGETRALSGTAERIGDPTGHLRLTDARGATLIDQRGNLRDHGAALEAEIYTREHFEDMPDIRDWVWTDL